MNNQVTLRLSVEEAEYICHLMSEDGSFAGLLRRHLNIRVGSRILSLDRAKAELLRDYLTERFAKVGFDENYEPNREGVMLEKLIDTFFLPTNG